MRFLTIMSAIYFYYGQFHCGYSIAQLCNYETFKVVTKYSFYIKDMLLKVTLFDLCGIYVIENIIIFTILSIAFVLDLILDN